MDDGRRVRPSATWLLALALCGCTTILGDDFEVVATSAGGAGGSGATGGSAGTGGTGASAGTGGTIEPGALLWSKRFGDPGRQGVADLALDSTGNILLTGSFNGSIDFGNGPLVSAGGLDVLVAKLSPDGEEVWSQRFGSGDADQIGWGIGVDSQNNVVVGGDYAGTVNFGLGDWVSPAGTDNLRPNVFVAKFESTGFPVWSYGFGDAATQVLYALAIGADDRILVGGFSQGGSTLDFGGACGSLVAGGPWDMWLAELDPNGACTWARTFPGLNSPFNNISLAPWGASGWLVGGSYDNSIVIDGVTYWAPAAADFDAYVMALQWNTGLTQWQRTFSATDAQEVRAVRTAPNGQTWATGYFGTSIDFQPGALTSAGGSDAFLATLDGYGATLNAKRYGDTSNDSGTTLAFDSAGNVRLAGGFGLTMDLGGNPLTSIEGQDIFLAALDPSFGLLWARSCGGPQDQFEPRIAVDGAGATVLGATFAGKANCGGGDLESAGDWDVLLAKFAP